MFYSIIASAVGEHALLWHEDKGDMCIEKICIPPASPNFTKGCVQKDHPDMEKVAAIINGKRNRRLVEWALKRCDFSGCTAWQQSIWCCLATEVPSGQVISYGGLAAKLGRPGAARSVGSCMAKNRFPLLIPCHRVVASGGHLGGFMNGRSDGLAIKRKLLASESVFYAGNTLKNDEALIA